MVDNSQIKQNLVRCNKIIEYIRSNINSGKCKTCVFCKELTNLHQALICLTESLREKFPIEAEFLQGYLGFIRHFA